MHILYGPKGMKRWQWYEEAQQQIIGRIGATMMLHEAASEVYRLRSEGHGPLVCMNKAEAYLRSLWRPRFSTKYATYEPPTLPLVEGLVGRSYSMDEQESEREAHRLRTMKIAAIMRAVTEREWELIVTYANCGSQTEAARLCGTKQPAVARALKKARAAGEAEPVMGSVYKGDGPQQRDTVRLQARAVA